MIYILNSFYLNFFFFYKTYKMTKLPNINLFYMIFFQWQKMNYRKNLISCSIFWIWIGIPDITQLEYTYMKFLASSKGFGQHVIIKRSANLSIKHFLKSSFSETKHRIRKFKKFIFILCINDINSQQSKVGILIIGSIFYFKKT